MYGPMASASNSSPGHHELSHPRIEKNLNQSQSRPSDDLLNKPSPYRDMQTAVQSALESQTSLSSSAKVALALEILRARQLELDLSQARKNIDSLLTKQGSLPRTLRSVIPASATKGLPIGTPVDISKARFMLSPTANDPSALFLTLDIQEFGTSENDSSSPRGKRNSS